MANADLVVDTSLVSPDANGANVDAVREWSSLADVFEPYVSDAPYMSMLALTDAKERTEDGAPTGFAAVLRGDTPLKRKNPFVTDDLSSGVTMLQVASSSIDPDSLPQLIESENKQNADAPPSDFARALADAPNLEVSLVSTRAEDEYKDSYYLIARGNHEEAVKTALDEVLPSSSDAAAAPVTLHAVATSKAVQALSRTSAEWREMHLRKLAAAFGWEVANNVTLDQETHFVKQTHAVGNPAPAGVSSAAKRANYIVYHTATDPSTSSGGSVVFHGSYASYTWYVGKKKGGPDGRPTQAFPVRTEERPFSVLPAHSGEHAGPDSHRVPSRHVRMSSKTKAEATRRITWHSEIQSYNPHVLKVHNAPDHSWQQLERSFGANAGGPIKKQSMQILFSRVPGMHVSHLPFTKLKSYLKVLKEPVLPVAIDGDAVAGIQTHWHAIRQAVPDKTSSFASVFDDQVSETHVRINTDILRALAKITDSTDANEA